MHNQRCRRLGAGAIQVERCANRVEFLGVTKGGEGTTQCRGEEHNVDELDEQDEQVQMSSSLANRGKVSPLAPGGLLSEGTTRSRMMSRSARDALMSVSNFDASPPSPQASTFPSKKGAAKFG